MLKTGDWLLFQVNNELNELSIFAMVLELGDTFVKVARWQGFGRLRISDSMIPYNTLKESYIKIGSFNKLNSEQFDRVRTLINHIPEEELQRRAKEVFDYDRAVYNVTSSTREQTLETILVSRSKEREQDSLEGDILRLLDSIEPVSEDIYMFKSYIINQIEDLYKDKGWVICRDLEGNLYDIIKN